MSAAEGEEAAGGGEPPRGGAATARTPEEDRVPDTQAAQHLGDDGVDSARSQVSPPGEKVSPPAGKVSPGDGGSSSSSESCIPTPSCRICFQGAEQGELLHPCRCDGSVRYTHQRCLLKWISERGRWNCELCCYRFQLLASTMKRPWQWQAVSVSLVEKVQLVAVLLGVLFLVSSVSWLLWSVLSAQAAWQRRDALFQVCYALYGCMDLVCLGLIFHEGAAVCGVLWRWRALNLHWDVRSYDKATDLEQSAAAPASLVPRTLWLPLGALRPSRHGPRTRTRCCLPRPPPAGSQGGPDRDQDGGPGEAVVRVTSV